VSVDTVIPRAECFRHNDVMDDWERLGRYVVARRVERGFKTRGELASAVQVSSRLLGDIEKGRRGNYDPVTIASLESALGWETGSVRRIVDGGEPQLRSTPPSVTADEQPDEIELIYRSQSMTARQKLDAIRMVLQLRAQAEQENLPVDRDTTISNNG
jgi:hypothetical protein